MRNVFKEFADIFPDPPLQVGTVTAVDAPAGVATIELPGGGILQARGDGVVGQRVFVRNGLIEGEAPSLPIVIMEI